MRRSGSNAEGLEGRGGKVAKTLGDRGKEKVMGGELMKEEEVLMQMRGWLLGKKSLDKLLFSAGE